MSIVPQEIHPENTIIDLSDPSCKTKTHIVRCTHGSVTIKLGDRKIDYSDLQPIPKACFEPGEFKF